MKKIVSMILAVAILLLTSVPLAEKTQTEEHFVFRNGITWGMSPDEVNAIEGDNDGAYTILDSNISEIYYEHVKVSKETAKLGCVFAEDKLFLSFYYIDASADQDYLRGALSVKYGEPNNVDPSIIAAFMNSVEGSLSPDDITESIQWMTNDTTIWMFKLDDALFIMYHYTDSAWTVLGIYDTFGL